MNIFFQFLISLSIVMIGIKIWNWYLGWTVRRSCKKLMKIFRSIGLKGDDAKNLEEKLLDLTKRIIEDSYEE